MIDLTKASDSFRVSLKKAGIVNPPSIDVAFDLDVSGSFDATHRRGVTNSLLTRLIPWGMVFDPDKKIDVFTFSHTRQNVCHVGAITPDSYQDYIRRNIIDRVAGYNGGTDYSYVIEENLRHFGWIPEKKNTSTGFFGKIFGGGRSDPSKSDLPIVKKPSLIFFVTDGENSDGPKTEQILLESQQRRDKVYFLFIAVSSASAPFTFLRKIADRFSNTGLVIIRDLNQFVSQDDQTLNSQLLSQELIDWLT